MNSNRAGRQTQYGFSVICTEVSYAFYKQSVLNCVGVSNINLNKKLPKIKK